jgi:hypothetical protein
LVASGTRPKDVRKLSGYRKDSSDRIYAAVAPATRAGADLVEVSDDFELVE